MQLKLFNWPPIVSHASFFVLGFLTMSLSRVSENEYIRDFNFKKNQFYVVLTKKQLLRQVDFKKNKHRIYLLMSKKERNCLVFSHKVVAHQIKKNIVLELSSKYKKELAGFLKVLPRSRFLFSESSGAYKPCSDQSRLTYVY